MRLAADGADRPRLPARRRPARPGGGRLPRWRRRARPGPAGGRADLPPGDAIAFRILRDGAEVGSHRIDFERRGETTIARVAIDIAVSYAWVTVYRFDPPADRNLAGRPVHRHREPHRRQRHRGLDAHRRRSRRRPAGVGQRHRALCRAARRARLHLLEPGHPAGRPGDQFAGRAAERAACRVRRRWRWCPASAARCRRGATRCMATLEMEIWYDLDDQWAHMRFRRDGSVITYLRA